MNDLEIIEQVKNGNTREYSRIMDHYSGQLFYLFFQMVRNKNDAEDLVMETFEKAYINLYRFVPEYTFRTWLFKIARNHGLDFISKKSVLKGYADLPLHYSSKDLNAEEKIIRKETSKELRKAIDRLSESARMVITMQYFQGYTFKEIADLCEIDINAALVQSHRAKIYLRNYLTN